MGGYRVLALSGGGVRGILQAVFLQRLEAQLEDLGSRFDLIAATSTGALVGLGIAAGISAAELAELYREHIPGAFRGRPLGAIRRGARYSRSSLRDVLQEKFGDRCLRDLDMDVAICASALDRYEGRIFTRADKDMTLVDVALASAAAPTYFPPLKPVGFDRGYVDGGLWANDPLLVAVGYAVSRGVDPRSIEALSIGTGRRVRGTTPLELDRMRTLSIDTVRFLIEIGGSLQEWATRHLLDQLAPGARIHRINPELPRWIGLDDTKRALSELPGIAESEFDLQREGLVAWLGAPKPGKAKDVTPLDPILESGIREANLSRFIPARGFYALAGGGRESISSYVATAKRTVTMVSINLATGKNLENIELTFQHMLERDQAVRIRLSLLDYEDPALMEAVGSILGLPGERTARDIAETMGSLVDFRQGLDEPQQQYLELFVHRTIPPESAILIDASHPYGRIQLETKPYRVPRTASWALEVEAGSEFFETQRRSYHQLILDGYELDIDGRRLQPGDSVVSEGEEALRGS